MRFHHFTIALNGELAAKRQHQSRKLRPTTIETFKHWIKPSSPAFRRPIPGPSYRHIELHWTANSADAAIATFYAHGVPLTCSALVTGIDPEADQAVQRGVQAIVASTLGGTAVEPSFDCMGVAERPAIISYNISSNLEAAADLKKIAELETLLAAAFFEIVL